MHTQEHRDYHQYHQYLQRPLDCWMQTKLFSVHCTQGKVLCSERFFAPADGDSFSCVRFGLSLKYGNGKSRLDLHCANSTYVILVLVSVCVTCVCECAYHHTRPYDAIQIQRRNLSRLWFMQCCGRSELLAFHHAQVFLYELHTRESLENLVRMYTKFANKSDELRTGIYFLPT